MSVARSRVFSSSRAVFWSSTSAVFCIVYAALLNVNIHPAGDGAWFWCAANYLRGARLYADQHLALQPLFVIQTALTMKLFGTGWLMSKLPAAGETLAFLFALQRITARLPIQQWQKAILTTGAFCLGTLFAAYRADDYHILADCFTLYSVLIFLRLREGTRKPVAFLLGSVLLGTLSGLAITTRLNDGVILLASNLVILLFAAPTRKLWDAIVCASAALVTVSTVIFSIGDSFRDYLFYSVLHVAGNKGGTGSVFSSIFLLPLRTVKILIVEPDFRKSLIEAGVCFAILLWLIFSRTKKTSPASLTLRLLGIAAIASIGYSACVGAKAENMAATVAGVWMLVTLSYCAAVIVQLARTAGIASRFQWDGQRLLLLIPAGQLLSSSMSSAGYFTSLYAPAGLALVVLPLSFSAFSEPGFRKNLLLITAGTVLVFTTVFKIQSPFAWHSYNESPVFVNRLWYRHPLYGEMYIDAKQLEHFRGVCSTVAATPDGSELLSLPYPYANYFCGTSPWHGYSQTFFDTADKSQVLRLASDLTTQPPKWILYQRQMKLLKLHEVRFNHRLPLPQRTIDSEIMDNIARGTWKVVAQWNSAENPVVVGTDLDADWMLIETR